MEVSARVNCGYPGISPQDCASRKCCFSDTIPEVPWCFFPKPVQGNAAAGGPVRRLGMRISREGGSWGGGVLTRTSCRNATEAPAPDPGVAVSGNK